MYILVDSLEVDLGSLEGTRKMMTLQLLYIPNLVRKGKVRMDYGIQVSLALLEELKLKQSNVTVM